MLFKIQFNLYTRKQKKIENKNKKQKKRADQEEWRMIPVMHSLVGLVNSVFATGPGLEASVDGRWWRPSFACVVEEERKGKVSVTNSQLPVFPPPFQVKGCCKRCKGP